MKSGIRIVAETEGTGATAAKGDAVTFECAAFLNRGAEIHPRRRESTVLGSRRLIAGVEAALAGMRVGGYRKVRISPHLAYGATGVAGKVPAGAVVLYELWLGSVIPRNAGRDSSGTPGAAREVNREKGEPHERKRTVSAEDEGPVG